MASIRIRGDYFGNVPVHNSVGVGLSEMVIFSTIFPEKSLSCYA
jgi:hypothetical protein